MRQLLKAEVSDNHAVPFKSQSRALNMKFFFASALTTSRFFPHPRTEPLLCLTGNTELQQNVSHKVIIHLEKTKKPQTFPQANIIVSLL